MTLRTVLLSLQALLAAAEPDDPQDAVVANQVRKMFVCALNTALLLFSWQTTFSVKKKSLTQEYYNGTILVTMFISYFVLVCVLS